MRYTGRKSEGGSFRIVTEKKVNKLPSPTDSSNVPWSKVAILGMVTPPFNRNPYNGYINPYYWVDDHPLLYGNNGSLDPGTNGSSSSFSMRDSNYTFIWYGMASHGMVWYGV